MRLITYKVDGYLFGERMLETIYFDVTVDLDTHKVTDFQVNEQDAKQNAEYLKGLNLTYWCEVGRKAAEETVEEIYADYADPEDLFTNLEEDGTLGW